MDRKKKVGIIGTNGLPGKYGGWDQLVIHLTTHLKSDFEFIVYTSYTNISKETKFYQDTKLKRVPFKANGIQSIPYDIYSMIHAIFVCDVLFICGTSGCVFLPFVRLFKRKIVLNPDGQEWKRGKWSGFAKWFLKTSEKFGIRFSSDIAADNIYIQQYLKEEYNKSSELIEYGGDQVLNVKLSEATASKYDIQAGKYAFKVCRIEPENNIDLILDAFSVCDSVKLMLIGNWNNSEYGISTRKKYAGYTSMMLLDPIYEQTILDELRSNCGIYVHGHSVGGTNPSLVEAMNLGLNIAAFDVCYNRATTEDSAHFFKNKQELSQIIFSFASNELASNSNNMLQIARNRYKWSVITEKYKHVFTR